MNKYEFYLYLDGIGLKNGKIKFIYTEQGWEIMNVTNSKKCNPHCISENGVNLISIQFEHTFHIFKFPEDINRMFAHLWGYINKYDGIETEEKIKVDIKNKIVKIEEVLKLYKKIYS